MAKKVGYSWVGRNELAIVFFPHKQDEGLKNVVLRGANGSCGKLFVAFEKGCTPDVAFTINFSPLRKDYN